MRKSFYLITALLCFTIFLNAFNKSTFDITDQEHQSNAPQNSLARIPYPGHDYLSLENEILEAIILKEGYLTLGTTAGVDPGILDNYESLTYGHPLAHTSYPILTVDQTPFRLDQYFENVDSEFDMLGDTLIALELNNEILNCRFEIKTTNTQDQVGLALRLLIQNISTEDHTISTGFLLDPALGTWGDGALAVAGVPIQNVTTWTDTDNVSSLIIDERRNLNTGMQMIIGFPDNNEPADLVAGNWGVLAGYQNNEVTEIYDLALNWENAETNLTPNSFYESIFTITLGETDYPDGPFMRSQLPQSLDIYDDIMRPNDFDCFTLIKNNSSTAFEDMVITLRGNQIMDDWSSPSLSIPAGAFKYEHIPLHFPEIYWDRVYPLTLELKSGNDVLDVIEHKCFVPTSPYSDAGLVVLADSVITTQFPQVSTRFSVTNEETGQYYFDLQDENILLVEDQTRILDFDLIPDTTEGTNSADIVFILDVTGSMGEEINGVKDNLRNFASNLDSQGVDFRLAMVTFVDDVENIYEFTSDVDLFQSYVDAQYAHGGGNWHENSLEAIYAGTQLQFRDQASKKFVWITDAGYHVNNDYTTLTVEDVVDALLLNGITCHAVAGEEIRVQYCDPIIYPTGGDFFDIGGNFLDILLEISEFNISYKYLLSYDSPDASPNQRNIYLEVHYAGLGGSDDINYTPPAETILSNTTLVINCYPNPFNPDITIDLVIPHSYTATAAIYNIRGQRVTQFNIGESGLQTLHWDAIDMKGRTVSAGVYLLQVSLSDNVGNIVSNNLIKLIHVK